MNLSCYLHVSGILGLSKDEPIWSSGFFEKWWIKVIGLTDQKLKAWTVHDSSLGSTEAMGCPLRVEGQYVLSGY